MVVQNELQIIISLISRWYAKIKLNNTLSFFDINRISESLVLELLNELFDTALIDLNEENSNYPGIDLGDKKNGIAFQVTSRTDAAKIYGTIENFISTKHNLAKQYPNGLYFFILSFDKTKFGNYKYEKLLPSFDKEKHVINFQQLVKLIDRQRSSNPKKFKEIRQILEKHFVSPHEHLDQYFFFSQQLKKSPKVSNKDFLELFEKKTLPKYLKSQFQEFEKIKTFLNPELRPFSEVYFPLKIKSQSGRKHTLTTNSIGQLLDRVKFATIFGGAGSGKSTLIKHLLIDCLENYYKIPIFIELRNLNDYDGSIYDFIAETKFFNEVKPGDGFLHYFFNLGNILFLFDGYDEVFSKSKIKRATELKDFVNTYDSNSFVITSRPGTNIEMLSRFQNYSVEPLTHLEVHSFLKKNIYSKKLIQRIWDTVNSNRNKDYIHFLSNPLLLSMYIRNFEFHPELPQHKSRFYYNLFDTLYQRHDGENKLGFIHEKKTGLIREKFEEILKIFSLLSFFEGVFSFDEQYLLSKLKITRKKINVDINLDDLIYDLHVSIAILVKDGAEYKFPHRSLQEYFSAFCISGLKHDSKTAVYGEKIPQLVTNSDDNLNNFWELCLELDKKYFLNHFLIPEIKNYINKLSGKSKKQVWAQACIFFDFEIQVQDSGKGGQLSLFHYVDVTYKAFPVLTFLGIDHNLSQFFNQEKQAIKIEEKMIIHRWDDLKKLYPPAKDENDTYEEWEEDDDIERDSEEEESEEDFEPYVEWRGIFSIKSSARFNDPDFWEFSKEIGLDERFYSIYKQLVEKSRRFENQLIADGKKDDKLVDLL